jgi:hypothetical protein
MRWAACHDVVLGSRRKFQEGFVWIGMASVETWAKGCCGFSLRLPKDFELRRGIEKVVLEKQL